MTWLDWTLLVLWLVGIPGMYLGTRDGDQTWGDHALSAVIAVLWPLFACYALTANAIEIVRTR